MKNLTRLLMLLGLIYSAIHLFHSLWAYKPLGDFLAHREDLTKWIEKGAFEWKRPSANSFDYVTASPLHDVLIIPLVYLSEKTAVGLNLFVNLLLVACVFFLGSLSAPTGKKWLWWFWSLVLVLNFRPFLMGMAMVKIEFIEVFFMALSLYLYRKQKDHAAGVALAFATLIKYFPGFLILFFLAKREKRVVTGFALGISLFTLITVGVFGWEHHFSFAQNLLSKQSWTYWVDNQSFSLSVMRLFVPFSPGYYLPVMEMGRIYTVLLWVVRVLLGVAIWAVTRGIIINRNERRWEWEAALWLGLAPVVIHFFRDYYFMLFFPFVFSFVSEFLEKPPRDRKTIMYFGGLLLAYLLVGQGFPLGVFTRLPNLVPDYSNFHLFLYLSIPFWGVLVYLLTSLWGLGTLANLRRT